MEIVPKSDIHLTMRVVDYIRVMIEDGRLRPGDKLPPERHLARSLIQKGDPPALPGWQ